MVGSATRNDIPAPATLDLLDEKLPTYDVALTEHLAVEANAAAVYEAATDFDFMTTRSPVVGIGDGAPEVVPFRTIFCLSTEARWA